jgi:hypothetical protein
MVAVDALILGGGVQGLVLMDKLAERGDSCLLVTPTDLGTGQRLHSRGLLNSGNGLLTGQTCAAVDEAFNFAKRRGCRCVARTGGICWRRGRLWTSNGATGMGRATRTK